MANLNKVLLMGNLTRDPDIQYTPSGKAVAILSLAINESFSDGNGGWRDSVTYIEAVAWGASAENCGKYLTKGRLIFIEGRLTIEQWEDKTSGQKRQKMKVVAKNVQFLGTGKAEPSSSPTSRPTTSAPSAPVYDEDGNEDIPF